MESISKPFQQLPSKAPPPTQEDQLLTTSKPAVTEKRAGRRIREVNSRYLLSSTTPNPLSSTPIPSSPALCLSSGDPPFPRLKKHHHQGKNRRHSLVPPSSAPDTGVLESKPSSCFADENRPAMAAAEAEVEQILVTPLPLGFQGKAVGTERKRAVRLFGDNGVEEQRPPKIMKRPKQVDVKLHSRKPGPGTPMLSASDQVSIGSNGTPRPSSLSQNLPRSINFGATSLKRTVAQARKAGLVTPARVSPSPLEEDSISGLESSFTHPSEAELCHASGRCEFRESHPVMGQENSRIRAESDHLLNGLARQLPEVGGLGRDDHVGDSCQRMSSSSCHRTPKFALSNCQQPPFNPTKCSGRPPASFKSQVSMERSVALNLPPQPPITTRGMDLKKGKKAWNHREDAHALRLLNNCYLQWRFINAKAQAAVRAQTIAAEKSLYSHAIKLSELRDSVAVKRIELEKLKRARNLQDIVEDQLPYLDQWTAVEGDHSNSLLGAVNSMQDASLRLPVIGDVKADINELDEVLKSAPDMLEETSSCVLRFLLQAEGVENAISKLARVVSREKALFEECRDLILMAHELQVKECSLRAQLIQQKQKCVK